MNKRTTVAFIQTVVTPCSCMIAFGLFNLFYRYFNSPFSLPIRTKNEP